MATAPSNPERRDAILGTTAVALAAALWAVSAVIAKSLFEDGVGAIPLSQARAFIAFAGFGVIYAVRRPPRTPSSRGPGNRGVGSAVVKGAELPAATAGGGAAGGGAAGGVHEVAAPDSGRSSVDGDDQPENPDDTAGRLWPQLIGIGVAIALVNAAYYIAIDRLQVAVAIVIQYTAPALVVIWVAVTVRSMPRPRTVVAVVAATLGVALAADLIEADLGLIDAGGLLAAAASAVFFAGYTLLSERVSRSIGPLRTMLWAFGAASFFWLCFQIPRGFPTDLIAEENLLRVVAVGVTGTLLPFLLYVWGIHRVAAEKAVIAATLEPPLAALAAWIWLGQTLSPLQLIGGALVLGAIAILQIQTPPPDGVPPPG